MKQSIKRFLSVLSAMLFVVSAYAQVTTSSMSGKVSDDRGPLAGATVVAVYQPTGAQYYAVSDARGHYRLNGVTAGGPYKVTFSCLGYSDKIYTDVTLALSDNLVIDAVLKEESLALGAVTVSAESASSNMRSDRAGALTSLSAKEMMEVPTISRSMNDILKQTPQAFVSGTKTYIGGGSYRDSYVTVDGAAFNNAFGIGSNLPAGGSPISLDALDQIAIAITPFDVRQSGFTGGGINATTKSGTNEVKATAYTYFKNQDMEGYKVGDYTLSKTDNRYLMYGASVGGPIIKDKVFFFLNVEADRSISPGPTRKLSERAVDADGKLYDAGTVYTDGNDGYARPSGVVLDAVADALRQTYGYEPGKVTGYNTETPSLKILGRLDWNINKDHKFNLRYSLVNSKYASAPSTSRTGYGNNGFAKPTCTSMTAAYFQNARYYQEQNHRSIAGELNSRFLEGKLNNTLRVSYSHQYEPRSVDGGYFPYVDLVVDGKIYTTFGYEGFSFGNLRDVSTLVATDEVNYTIGKHNILAGVQFEYDHTENGFQRFGAGAFQYDYESEQALYDAVMDGTWLDSPTQFVITHGNNKTFAQEYPHFNFLQTSFYLQDDYSVSDNFKLTAGLRFEVPQYPSLDFNRNLRVEEATFAPTASTPSGKYNTVDLPKARLSVSPRIGFNWDILGDRKYVLRGGTGVFIGRIPFVWIVAQSGDAGVLQTTVTKQVANGDAIPTIGADRDAILKQIYPNGYSAQAAGLNLTSITLMDKNLSNPMSWKSSLAFDAQLPYGFVGSIEGVYKKDINPIYVNNIAKASPTQLIEVPDIAARPYYSNGSYDSQITNAYLLYNVTNPALWGYYYSLTAKLEKKPWHGLSGQISYTYAASKVLHDGISDQVYSVWSGFINKNGQNVPELGYASYVMPHRIVANVNYSVDYAKYFGSSISVAYYGGPTSRGSADYLDEILGTGGYNYDLIDIPTRKALDEWTFVDYDVKDANKNVVFSYPAEEQKADFWAYIQQDKYLSKNTGKVAERNGLVFPWVHKFDVKFNQNFYFYTGANNHKHTVQLGVDIENVGNLLNSNWGNVWNINGTDGYGNVNPLKLLNAKAVYTEGAKPQFQFQPNGTKKLTTTYSRANSFSSTWEMILSLRYIF